MKIHFPKRGVLIIHPLLFTRTVSYYLPLLCSCSSKSRQQNNEIALFSTKEKGLGPADTFQVSNFRNADGRISLQKIKPVTKCLDNQGSTHHNSYY